MKYLAACLFLMLASPVIAKPVPLPPVAQQVVEIYHIVPGQHEAFLRFIDKCDEANRIAGLPPRQLFVHSDGAEWDFMLIQPAKTPTDKAAALDAAWTKVGLPKGANFFFEIRKFIASHTDTFVSGPTTARDYLASAIRP
jgi:hypothetical protein